MSVRRAAAASRARRLPDAGDRLPDRPAARGVLLAGQRRRHVAGRRRGRADRRIKVDPMVRVVFFDLFLFATGYKVGPQFFRGLGRQALAQASLTVVLCVTSLVIALLAARVLHYDSGHCRGPHGGRLHRVHRDRHGRRRDPSAGPACRGRDAPAEQHPCRVRGELPGGYDVRGLVLSSLAPRLLRVDIRRKRANSTPCLSGATEDAFISAFDEWVRRAYVPRDGISSAGRSARSRRPSRRSASSSSGPAAGRRSRCQAGPFRSPDDVVAIAGRRSAIVGGGHARDRGRRQRVARGAAGHRRRRS